MLINQVSVNLLFMLDSWILKVEPSL